jgi:hypothetical protein
MVGSVGSGRAKSVRGIDRGVGGAGSLESVGRFLGDLWVRGGSL